MAERHWLFHGPTPVPHVVHSWPHPPPGETAQQQRPHPKQHDLCHDVRRGPEYGWHRPAPHSEHAGAPAERTADWLYGLPGARERESPRFRRAYLIDGRQPRFDQLSRSLNTRRLWCRRYPPTWSVFTLTGKGAGQVAA